MITAATVAALGLGGCPDSPPVAPAIAASGSAGASAAAAGDSPLTVENVPLVPRPAVVNACRGEFALSERTVIHPNHPAAYDTAKLLGGWLGSRVVDAVDVTTGPVIELQLEGTVARDPAVAPPTTAEEERYAVDVAPGRVAIRSRDLGGLFHAAQAFAQLALARPIEGSPTRSLPIRRRIPCAHFEDVPRFPIRAMHLDVARHFFDAAVVERYIDIIAFYNFNVFHWHLTDDQGFRLPLAGLETNPHYTKDDVARVIAFARARGVTVVPELEMPGHARAILAKRPDLSCTGKPGPVATTWGVFEDILCAGNPATTELVDQVLGELSMMFPSTLVHVGGDEAPKTRWNACPKCRAAMVHEHIDAKGLETKFFSHVASTLKTHGKRMLAWDDALEAMPADGVAVAWQNAARGADAARKGHDVIMAPSETTYFNFWQSKTKTEPGHEGFIPWTTVLAFDAVPKDLTPEQRAHVLGGEGAIWTEYVKTRDELDTLLMPRLAALAEALGSRDARSFASRLTLQRSMLEDVHYFVEPPSGMPTHRAFLGTTVVKLEAPALWADAEVRFTTDGVDPSKGSRIFAELSIADTTTVRARTFLKDRSSPVVTGEFEKQSPRSAVTVASTVPGLDFDYIEGRFTAVPSDFTAVKLHGHMGGLGFDPRFRPDHFAVRYRGFVHANTTGIMTFTVKSDDGVVVDIGDKRVLEDDGSHAPREVSDTVALEAGLHPITIRYFQGGGGKSIELACNGSPCVFVTAK